MLWCCCVLFFFKQKTAYEMRISDWSSDVCSSDLIEAFYWAATLGNFAIAADRLHITQSSLSKRIAELEYSLQRQLFDRNRKKSTLTEAGEQLLPKCRAVLDAAEALLGEAGKDSENRVLSGACKFGISELSASTWLPRFIRSEEHTSELQSLLRNSYALF